MIVLSKREKETLHEISKWPEFPEPVGTEISGGDPEI